MDDVLLWATAVGSVLTAAATIGLVVVATRTLGGARDQLILQTQQAQRDGRPYVAAEVVPGLHGAGHWDLILRNYGRSVARSVVASCDSLEVRDSDDYISAPLMTFLATPRTLAPGARMRVMWRMEGQTVGDHPQAGAPGKASVTLRYSDDTGEVYPDVYDFDTEALGAIAPVPTEGPSATGNGKELANVVRALRTLNIHVGELRR